MDSVAVAILIPRDVDTAECAGCGYANTFPFKFVTACAINRIVFTISQRYSRDGMMLVKTGQNRIRRFFAKIKNQNINTIIICFLNIIIIMVITRVLSNGGTFDSGASDRLQQQLLLWTM